MGRPCVSAPEFSCIRFLHMWERGAVVWDLPGTATAPLPYGSFAVWERQHCPRSLSPSPPCPGRLCSDGMQHARSRGASRDLSVPQFPSPLLPRSLTRLPCVPAVPRLQRGGVLPSSSEKQVRDHGFRQLAAGGPAKPASVTALTLEEYLNTSVKALPICLRFQRNYSVYGKRERARESESTHARERDCCPFRSMFTLNKAASVCESPWS